MADRTGDRRAAGPPRGIVRTPAHEGRSEHRRVLPCAALEPFVAHFWWVRWALPAPVTVETLPHPSMNLVFEQGTGVERSEIAGVPTRRFVRQLAGEAHVFGVKFRPAGLRLPSGAALATIADRVLPVGEIFGSEGDALARAVHRAPDLEAKIAVAEGFLAPRLAPLPPEVAALRDLVERMAIDQTLLRVEDCAALAGVDRRTLQRRFRQHVGASPKWVLQRYRLHEAAERLKGPDPPSLAALAAELGYADQAHFTREFKQTVGRTPRQFRAGAAGVPGDKSP